MFPTAYFGVYCVEPVVADLHTKFSGAPNRTQFFSFFSYTFATRVGGWHPPSPPQRGLTPLTGNPGSVPGWSLQFIYSGCCTMSDAVKYGMQLYICQIV